MMKQLLKFELKKILYRKANLITIAIGLLLIVFSNLLLIHEESLLLEDGTQLQGLEAIRCRAEIENSLTATLNEEFLTTFLQEYQQDIQNADAEDNFSLIHTKINLFTLILTNYNEIDKQWEWDDLRKIRTDTGIHFYERRLKKIETILNTDYSFGNYTKAEKAYWFKKADSVDTPFVWGSKTTWDLIWTGIQLLFFQCFVINICLAPVFAGEYQNRTDSLILSSKHGKHKLILMKIAAALLFTLCYITLCAILSVGIHIAILGIDGFDLPVQLWDTTIPYELTAIEVCELNFFILLLISVLLTALTLMFSSVCKSQMIALAINILLFFGTIFLPFSKDSWLWNHILYLCPVYTQNLQNVLGKYVSYPFGNTILSYLDMTVIVYILLTLLCFWYAGINFQKHQVGK